MIPTEKKEILWVLDLVCEEKGNCFNALQSSVDVVSEEQIVSSRRSPACSEDAKKIMKLAVYVAANGQGRLELEQDRLLEKDVVNLVAQK
jgi:hypothetical protein